LIEEEIKKLEKIKLKLVKEFELLEKLKKYNKILYFSGRIDKNDYILLDKEISLFEKKIKEILDEINKLFRLKKLNDTIQKLPIPSKIKEIPQKNINKRIERIKKKNYDRIIVKKSLLKKLAQRRKLERVKELQKRLNKEKKLMNLKVKIPKFKFDLQESTTLNKIYDFFFFNFPFIYVPAVEFLSKFNLSRHQIRLLALIYTLLFIFVSYLAAIYLSLFILYFLKVITDVKLIIFFMKITFFIGIFLVILAIVYPYYDMKQKEQEINNILPFVLVHMSAIASSGINFYQVLRMIAETKEYKVVADEFEKIILLVDFGGMDLISAINLIADQTPSSKLREILRSISYILQSGGDIEKYLNQKAEEAIMNLRINKEKYIGFLDVFSDLYVILVVAIPILFISVVAVLGSFSPSEKLYKFTKFAAFVIIPLIDILFLVILNFQERS
jgi:pilus assembly protein TadC